MIGDGSRLLHERYRLGAKLGAGGMSTVWRGLDVVLQRVVAVKILEPAFVGDAQFVARFYGEARLAAQLIDRHVVGTYDVFTDREVHAIVMEYVDGSSLAAVLRDRGRLPEARAIDIVRQAALGLAVAHAHGILHRDLKPANLLLSRDGIVKMADFGLAKAAAPSDVTLTRPGMVFGSVHYFSPEQAEGRKLSAASDLYSLGIVLYELCVGQVPFHGDSPLSTALAQINAPIPTRSALRASMSDELACIVERLLQKNPAARFESAAELASALAAVGAHHPQDAPTVIVQRPPVPGRRRPALVDASRLIGVAFALTLAVLVAAFARHLAERRSVARALPTVTPVARAVFPRFPDFTGKSLAASTQFAAASSLQLRVARRASGAPPGIVIDQFPVPGARVVPHALLIVVVSAGPPSSDQ